ncbi:hypothetical protein F383_24853 [Gossypium arboreum]|uniref:Uncharacterized protein n=1 Tax=Gossypium arboreum TaxID=29729 RepID=A0A0B0MR99_GOSAR|nr:hypothetical protein F383_29790 [Gossypium arboreum]KHG07857.1 hypothetical protein F383_35081 [Gossypium arboreum]KHG09764.1 hypothetical protein F383_07835 [Gossypium arboreum]KHG19626.1 hypothetical protein F383_24853 [Gossypium arboreum]
MTVADNKNYTHENKKMRLDLQPRPFVRPLVRDQPRSCPR